MDYVIVSRESGDCRKPEIRTAKFHKDFYFGFYCTEMETQAKRWAIRFGDGYVNKYEYTPNPELAILSFPEMTEELLDFIAACRSGKPHSYDIVEGPMADDTIYNYVQGFLDGKYSRETFWSLVRFNSIRQEFPHPLQWRPVSGGSMSRKRTQLNNISYCHTAGTDLRG